jgi:hypothetical protein
MARVTVKDLRAEARRRLLMCGNGKSISRMNKSELITFLDCIQGSKNVQRNPVAKKARVQQATDQQVTVGNLFSERKQRRKKKRVPRAYNPIDDDSDDEDNLGGAGLPGNYRDFVRAMLPHVRAKGLAPQMAMKTVAMMWRKHKAQHGSGLVLSGTGLSLTGAQSGMGAASTISSTAKGAAATLGLAGLAQPEFAPILEPAAAASAGVGYIADLFK